MLADPTIAAWIKYRAARWRRTYRIDQQVAAMARLGDQRRPPNPLSYADPRLFEDVLQVAETEARSIAADEQDALVAAREAAGDGAL